MRNDRALIGAMLAAVVAGALIPAAAGGATRKPSQAAAGEYANPIKGLGGACSDVDPYMVKGPNHTFYLYYSTSHSCLPGTPAPACESAKRKAETFQDTYWVYKSNDPTRWPSRPTAKAITICTLRRKDPRVSSLWGAGAMYYHKRYYLFYSANEKLTDGRTKSIGVATSTSASGPFTDHGILVRGNANNWYYGVHPFQDPATGNIYLYFANHWKRIVVRRFDPKTNRVVGRNTVVLKSGLGLNVSKKSTCDRQTAATKAAGHQRWEHCVLEHPEVFYAYDKHLPASHRYFMLYNGAGGGTRRYAIGYAYSSSPTKPFTRSTAGDNPILREQTVNGRPFYGPGAPNAFLAGNSARWLFYRYYPRIPGGTFAPRKMALNRLRRKGGRLFITPTIGVNQPKPTW